MAIPMSRLGGRAFSSGDDDGTEHEYDRLRDLARGEAQKRNDCFERSRRAYEDDDHAGAKELSQRGKSHDAKMDDYNRQASEYIFRANNAPGRNEGDCIDLHGQFVEEAERILEQRIRADQAAGQNHLHAIVGKGNHSANHVQKLKPKVEEICRELGLKYRTEENAGRIYINLQGGEPYGSEPGQGAPHGGYHGGQQHGGQQQHGYPGSQGHHGQQQQHGGHHQQQQHGGQHQQQQHNNQQNDEVEKLVAKIFRKLEKACCTVM